MKDLVEKINNNDITRREALSRMSMGVGAVVSGLVIPSVAYSGGLLEKFGLGEKESDLEKNVIHKEVATYNMLSDIEEVDIENALKNSRTDYGVVISEAGVDSDSNYKRAINLSVVFVSKSGEAPKERLFYKSFVNQDALYPHENGKGVENAVSVPPVEFKKEGNFYMAEPFLVSGNVYANGANPMVATTQLMVAVTNEANNVWNQYGKTLKPENVMCLTPEINCEYNFDKSKGKIDLKQIYR
jgi:hypothetical protein